ncbi:MAG: protoporphyrinogen oxidase [Pseudomonadota bacterium]|nr:protoporphyrinogen oxidase [Pseudomonadota bacterium]
MNTDVLIIGGGISGLSVAWGLARRGVRTELWETDARPGGKIRSHREAGYLTEQAAALLLNFRPDVDRFIREAGLACYKAGQDRAREGRRYLVQDGRLRPVPGGLGGLMLSDLWSTRAKLRMLTEAFVPARADDGESVARFITRRLGREMLEKAIDPFVAGTLASDPEAADARCTLPRLTALENRYGSITLGVVVNGLLRRRTAHVHETFSFDGGVERLTSILARTPGLALRLGHEALDIAPTAGGWRVTGRGAGRELECRARRLVLSVPAPQAARLLAALDREAGELLGGIRYAPLAVLHLGLDRGCIQHPLDGIGFLTPRREQLNVNGNLWLGSLFPERAPRGRTLLTSYVGGSRNPQRADWDDGRLLDAVLAELRPLLGLAGEPEYLRVDRHSQALPQYHGHYGARLRALDSRLATLPGIELAANYKGGVSVRDRIAQGLATAEQVHRSLSEPDCPKSPPLPLSARPAGHG